MHLQLQLLSLKIKSFLGMLTEIFLLVNGLWLKGKYENSDLKTRKLTQRNKKKHLTFDKLKGIFGQI